MLLFGKWNLSELAQCVFDFVMRKSKACNNDGSKKCITQTITLPFNKDVAAVQGKCFTLIQMNHHINMYVRDM